MRKHEAGFSIVEVVVVAAVTMITVGLAAPSITAAIDTYQFNNDVQSVASTIRSARFTAVASNVRMQVRFNCPATGQMRVVEVTGNAGIDTAGDRCDLNAYPYPDPDASVAPDNDGPVVQMGSGTDLPTTVARPGDQHVGTGGAADRLPLLLDCVAAGAVDDGRRPDRYRPPHHRDRDRRHHGVPLRHRPRRPVRAGELVMNEAQDARGEAGFSLVETMVASLVLTIGLVGLAQLLAVATIMHSDARQATTGTILAQAKLDELMKVDFSLSSTVALGGSVASNMAPYFDQPETHIDRRWSVANGPVAGTRLLTVTVENKGGRLYGRSQTLTTVIRDW